MIAEKIKGLFSLFAGQIVKHVADLLNELSKQAELFEKKNDEKSDQLLIFLLCCLMKLALYDNEQFFNKDRFDLLMKPIVNQVLCSFTIIRILRNLELVEFYCLKLNFLRH